MCEHLKALESYLKEKNIPETFRGKTWTNLNSEWVYFDCFLDTEALKIRLNLPDLVQTHENTDLRSGTELGLFCSRCKNAIMGLHPKYFTASHKVMAD
jgi:hypothetical protein